MHCAGETSISRTARSPSTSRSCPTRRCDREGPEDQGEHPPAQHRHRHGRGSRRPPQRTTRGSPRCARPRSGDESFVFSLEPGGTTPPHPDVISHAFASLRDRAKVAGDVHLHSLRHFQATVIDSVVSERQKQARLGSATVHMARHYGHRGDRGGPEGRRVRRPAARRGSPTGRTRVPPEGVIVADGSVC